MFFFFFPLKPKTEKVYIPPFKMNNKENVYFARLDKGKSSDIDTEVSKPMSKSTVREHNKSIFVPTCHLMVLLVILDQIVLC